jgi:predicted metal-dependent hydrolase
MLGRTRKRKQASLTPKGINIRPRRMGFELKGGYRRHWAKNDPLKTSFLDAVSCILPMGEDFFLRTMRNYRSRITDADLARDARHFCGQEGHHAYEHRKFNRLLEENGYPHLVDIDAWQGRFNEWLIGVTSPQTQFSFTTGAEHLTSIMSHAFLSDPQRWVDDGEEIGAMLFWHTVEEVEHKSVCFDVFQHVSGSYAQRILGFMVLTGIMSGSILSRQLYMLYRDGLLDSPRTWVSLWRFYLGRHDDGKPGVVRLLLADYLKYLKPGFHPWDIDDRHLIEKWVAAFEAGEDMRQARISDLAA